jgi:glutamate carboxypeptidase
LKDLKKEIAASVACHIPQSLRFLQALVEINSHTGHSAGVNANAQLIANQFGCFGWELLTQACSEPNSGSHMALDSGFCGPTALIVSHLDTVYTEDEQQRLASAWIQEGENVRGPGVFDIKGGTAMMWLAMRVMEDVATDAFRSVRWLAAWNAAEERLAADFAPWCLGLSADVRAALVFEGDNGTRESLEIVDQRCGIATYRIHCKGVGAHAGNNHQSGRNAILGLARAALEISGWTNYQKDLTVNVGFIHGGEASNRVPDNAEALFEIRFSEPSDHLEASDSLVRLAANTAGNDILHIEQLSYIPPLSRNKGSRWLSSIWKDAARDCGDSISVGGRRGISDANYLSAHVPTIDGLGPCGGNPHGILHDGPARKITEFLDLSSMAGKTELNVLALIRLTQCLNAPPELAKQKKLTA